MPDRLPSFTDRQLEHSRLLDFARLTSLVATSSAGDEPIDTRFMARWPRAINRDLIHKAAVGAGSGVTASWSSSLFAPELQAAFVDFNRPATIIGRLEAARRAPLSTPVVTTTTGASSFAWVGAGRPKPLSSSVFDRTFLRPAIAGGIFVATKELLRLATPGSELTLIRDMSNGLAAFLDTQFISPTVAPITDIAPGSITNGVSVAATSTGEPVTDLRELTRAYRLAGGELTNAIIILSSENAVALAQRSGSGDEPVFPDITATGGRLGGLAALASDHVGPYLIMVDVSHILVADENGVDVRRSLQATIEMDSAPTQNAVTPTATTQVSLFTSDSVAFRIERYISWARTGAIAIVDGVNYLAEGGSP